MIMAVPSRIGGIVERGPLLFVNNSEQDLQLMIIGTAREKEKLDTVELG